MKVWRVTSALDKDTGSPTTCAEGKRSQERGWHLGIMTERARTEGTEETEVFWGFHQGAGGTATPILHSELSAGGGDIARRTRRARTEGTEDTEVFDTVEDDVGNGHRHRYTRQLSVSRKAERILA
jgi:hypothetical protein